jgi:hypothetical protein
MVKRNPLKNGLILGAVFVLAAVAALTLAYVKSHALANVVRQETSP